VRWIGWVVVVVVLAAMAFARMTDDTERRGRKPDTAPAVSESSASDACPGRCADANAHRIGALSESL
jgi:hypothetical protein